MNNLNHSVALFYNQKVRRYWDEDQEQWFFSIVDVILILTESINPQAYWRKLKERLKKEGNETVTNCHAFRMKAIDGKMRLTDVVNTEQLLRLIQAIPSKHAEPFKLWLARVGYEKIEENNDPEISFDRAMQAYLQKGYSKEWINQRLKSIEVRKELVDEWQERGVKEGKEYAVLTDEITRAWSGKKVKEYKKFKELKKENLRDNMTNLELVLNMLAEATTTEISKNKKPSGFKKNKDVAKQGGQIAGRTRRDIEKKTGKKIVSKANYLNLPGRKNLLD